MKIYFKHLPCAVIERLFHLLDVVFKAGNPTLAECRELVEGINAELTQERECVGNLLTSNQDLRGELARKELRIDAQDAHVRRLQREVAEQGAQLRAQVELLNHDANRAEILRLGTIISILRAELSGARMERDISHRKLEQIRDAETRANEFLNMEAARAVELRDALDKKRLAEMELGRVRAAAHRYANTLLRRDKEISQMVAAYHRYGHELKKIAHEHANEDE